MSARVIEWPPPGFSLHVTDVSGRAHTCGEDDGRTGWKRHAVRGDSGRAACGLLPRIGWGGDLFEDGMDSCARCLDALGACRSCHSEGRVTTFVGREGNTNCYQVVDCDQCDATGWRPEASVAHSARPLGAHPDDADEETISDVVNDSSTKAIAVAAMKIAARGRPDLVDILMKTRVSWDLISEIASESGPS